MSSHVPKIVADSKALGKIAYRYNLYYEAICIKVMVA